MAMDFSKSAGSSIASKVMKKAADKDMDNKKREISIDLIDLNPDNEEVFGYDDIDFLAETIKENGFNGVIEVYALNNGRYEISSGHRRYLAAKKLGMKTVPCLVSENTDETTKAKRLIMSNIHHRRMTPYHWAKALDYYDKHVLGADAGKWHKFEGGRRAELARQFGMTPSAVQRYTVLLKLIPEFAAWTKKQGFPYGNLSSIGPLAPDLQLEIYEELIKKAPEGDLAALSGTIVKQTAETVKQRREYERLKAERKNEERKNEIREDEVEEQEHNNSNSYISENISVFADEEPEVDEDFSLRMNDRLLVEEKSEVVREEAVGEFHSEDNLEENNDNSKECLYYIRRLGAMNIDKTFFEDEEEKKEIVRILEKLLNILK